MKNLEISKFGISDLTENEIINVNGGFLWIPVAVATAIVMSAVSNFGDIADGFVDGLNGRDPRYHHN